MESANHSPATATPSAALPRTWPQCVQSTLFVVMVSAVVGVLAHSMLHGNVQRPVAHPGEAVLTRIDLNYATRGELLLLPGVGEQMAQRIEAFRILNGAYASIDDLSKVPGIGPLTIERLRPWLMVRAPARTTPADALPMNVDIRGASKKEEALSEPIDINAASADELQKLPGIGPKLSQRIVATRSQALFKNVDELRRVPGIGVKTIAKLRPYVSAGTGVAAVGR